MQMVLSEERITEAWGASSALHYAALCEEAAKARGDNMVATQFRVIAEWLQLDAAYWRHRNMR